LTDFKKGEKMKKVTVDDIMALGPCYSREQVEALWAGRESLTGLEISEDDDLGEYEIFFEIQKRYKAYPEASVSGVGPSQKGEKKMNKLQIIQKLCKLTSVVHAHIGLQGYSADCFCRNQEIWPHDSTSNEIIRFIQEAVKEKMLRENKEND
jgi:hypothetical protein